jgi:hypothetical protein
LLSISIELLSHFPVEHFYFLSCTLNSKSFIAAMLYFHCLLVVSEEVEELVAVVAEAVVVVEEVLEMGKGSLW